MQRPFVWPTAKVRDLIDLLKVRHFIFDKI